MRKTVMLVDDVQLYLEIEKEFLQHNAVSILTARDGLEALDVAKKGKPDLIYMDLQMPKMGGAESCRFIKSDVSLLHIPIVMITSKNDEDMKACFDARCDHFLSKPLDRDKFLGIARQFLPDIDRREVRKKVDLSATVRINGDNIRCTVIDLSIGGAFLATSCCGIPKSVVKISFSLPDGTAIECDGRISWLNRFPGNYPPGFGIQFALMAAEMKKRLAVYLNTVTQVHPTADTNCRHIDLGTFAPTGNRPANAYAEPEIFF